MTGAPPIAHEPPARPSAPARGLREDELAARLATSPWAEVPLERFAQLGWQRKHRITDPAQLDAWLHLSPREWAGLSATQAIFRFAVLPYFALLADPKDPRCPIRRQIVPSPEEATVLPGERADPLGEEPREAAPNLIHRYPDRALLLITDRCDSYCRFCTRRRVVGRTERRITARQLSEALSYVRAHPELRELIISGGDALSLGDEAIDGLLADIRQIPHIELIRVASRTPSTAPMRVSARLAKILRRHAPVVMMTHFNHPAECTAWAEAACARLVDAGVPVYNQTVLLAGINDRLEVIAALNRRLVNMRVTPYYLHQGDVAEGIEHFRTPLQTGVDIIDGLRGHTSGLMVPKLCVDVPGGLGKVTVLPEWILGREGRWTHFRTYSGARGSYPDPIHAEPGRSSADNEPRHDRR